HIHRNLDGVATVARRVNHTIQNDGKTLSVRDIREIKDVLMSVSANPAARYRSRSTDADAIYRRQRVGESHDHREGLIGSALAAFNSMRSRQWQIDIESSGASVSLSRDCRGDNN